MVNHLRATIFPLLLLANTAQSITCSPLLYQLATETLSAKWGAPFNILLLGEVTKIGYPTCNTDWYSGELQTVIAITGTDLRTGIRYQNLPVSVFHIADRDCTNKIALETPKLSYQKNPLIFFLEVDGSSQSFNYTLQSTICGSSTWGESHKEVIRNCFLSTSCSLDWFESQEWPQGYSNVFYK